MTKRHTPPGRMSKALVVVEKPFGPHHCARCFGSVHACHTNARGASNSRMAMMACGSRSRSMLFRAATRLPLGLQLAQVIVQAIETFLPEAAIGLEPRIDALEGVGLDAAGPPLRLAAARDEARTLQHLEMLGDGRKAHLERLRHLGHGRLAQHEPRQDGATRRIGESRERGAEAIGRHDVVYRTVK